VHVATYSSFNLFGIIIILFFSAVIILLDFHLPSLVHKMQRSSPRGSVAHQAWEEDEILQIQRLALEGRGVGPWKQMNGSVPVTDGWDVKFKRERMYNGGNDMVMESQIQSFEFLEPLTVGKPHGGRDMVTPQSSVSKHS